MALAVRKGTQTHRYQSSQGFDQISFRMSHEMGIFVVDVVAGSETNEGV